MVFGGFERMMALRYLRPRRQQGFVSVIAVFSALGILLGVGTLIVVMAVMNGFRQELLGLILGVNGHLTVYGGSGAIDDYEGVARRLRELPGVESVTPQVQAQVIVTVGDQAVGALVRGVALDDLSRRALVFDKVVAGSLEGFAAEEGVLIGRRMARNLRLRPDDRITLLAPRGNQTVIGTVPRVKSYPVAGLFEIGMTEYDSSFVYMPLALAQTFFRLPQQVNSIEIVVEDPDAAWLTRTAIAEALGPGFRTVSWQQANSGWYNAVRVERNVMFLILSLIILVAAFNILSGQYMLVKGKGRDIAILRTMGASRAMVLRIFFMNGAVIGMVGTLLGVIAGILVTDNIDAIQAWVERMTGASVFNPEIYFLTNLPAERDAREVLQVVAMSLAISFMAPLLPAWRAARLDPVEALRYE